MFIDTPITRSRFAVAVVVCVKFRLKVPLPVNWLLPDVVASTRTCARKEVVTKKRARKSNKDCRQHRPATALHGNFPGRYGAVAADLSVRPPTAFDLTFTNFVLTALPWRERCQGFAPPSVPDDSFLTIAARNKRIAAQDRRASGEAEIKIRF